MAKKYKWHKLANSENEIDWTDNGIAVLKVDEKWICLTRWNGKFYSFANKCPHAGGPLDRGFIDKTGHIICPLHAYKFNLQTGISRAEEGFKLTCWPIEQREDGIYIGFEEKGLFNWF